MRKDIAAEVKIGDTVYNCFLIPMTVIDKTVFLERKGSTGYIKFIVKDSENNTHSYDCDDLYLQGLEDESDEEKSWVNWAKDNQDFFGIFNHISTIKEIYKIGFANGFDYRRRISYEEMMQK